MLVSTFFSAEDLCRFYLLLQEGIERYTHRVRACTLRINHAHLVIQVGSISLSRIMQNLSCRYTRWINKRRGRSGHLFQGRYKAFLVDTDRYLLEIVAYFHLNPVRAGMVDRPERYPWSSHRAYLGHEAIPWLNPDCVLTRFAANLDQARRLFDEFVAERTGGEHREEFYGKGSLEGRLIGNDLFVERVLREANALPLRRPSMEDVVKIVPRVYKSAGRGT